MTRIDDSEEIQWANPCTILEAWPNQTKTFWVLLVNCKKVEKPFNLEYGSATPIVSGIKAKIVFQTHEDITVFKSTKQNPKIGITFKKFEDGQVRIEEAIGQITQVIKGHVDWANVIIVNTNGVYFRALDKTKSATIGQIVKLEKVYQFGHIFPVE